ncbi:hypothetical protein SAMN05720766_11031 [Fibrobacter sp. UWH9]|uniref:hypothetical protein n=1 Tax=unclassified Fibrobacter TaxID=2634177 RepID=UPI000917A0CF|nr:MULTISPECIES: hypothetical protein [Fibrobacter]MCQ2100081.1 hypothetical protein [Fibrobacter sp.]MCL4103017.1 hypothetical protein [Fibrobacter succinogenes]MDO4947249.1 hypothetical protein [Fibrobacter sp.]OWV06446.1 hypothetical protein B7993_05850 [Fibrobacter sp. UWH3]OWV08790.1 hypothetical protein B7992_13040 [Fibrobacter sp. UWH1]
MKFSVLAFLTITAALLTACSGIVTPKAELASHDSDHSIPAIDNMIVSLKQEYINKCYMPVAKRNPPENACQSELFQTLERRYNLNFNQNHVAMAANVLFFKDVDAKIVEMSRNDPEVRNAIRAGAFTSTSEMLAYYKGKYQFETQLEQY